MEYLFSNLSVLSDGNATCWLFPLKIFSDHVDRDAKPFPSSGNKKMFFKIFHVYSSDYLYNPYKTPSKLVARICIDKVTNQLSVK